MYRLQFYRTFPLNKGLAFKRDSGYGVYVNNTEFAIAKTATGEWDITEVSTGIRVDESHKTFPTRDSAISWLKNNVDSIISRVSKHSDVKKALAEYKKPTEVVTHEQVGDITLTVKQSDFLTLYKSAFGTNGCVIKEIAEKIGFSPMTVGALMSTLVEKGVFYTTIEGGQKKANPSEAGTKILEEI